MQRLDLTLVRHARTIHDKDTVPPHDPDADLSDAAAFTRIARAIPSGAEWWVSPFKRCRMTADMLIASGAEPVAISSDERPAEQHYGTFHGRPIADVWAMVKDGPKSNWHFLHPDYCPPEGESFIMLHDRTAGLMRSVEMAETSRLVLIGHAMLFKSLIAHALDLPPARALALAIEPLTISRLTLIRDGDSTDSTDQGHGGRWSLNALNTRG